MICAVVLNWNAPDETIACLQSLRRIEDSRLSSIVVCDNGSSDDSNSRILSWMQHAVPDSVPFIRASEMVMDNEICRSPVVLIANQANGGYAAGCNPGVLFALKNDFEYIWILNNDTRVHPDAATALLNFSGAHPDAGVIGSTLVDFDFRDRVQCTGGCYYSPLTTVFRYAEKGQSLPKAISTPLQKELDYVYGASMFIRSEVFRRIGMLSEDYFLFYEELDFCHRAQAAGYRLAWCPGSVIYHKQSRSFENLGTVNERECIANYHENLSTLIFTERFYPLLFPAACLLRFVGKILKIMIYNKHYLLHPLWDAYFDFFCLKSEKKHSRLSADRQR
jgi:GT2 family glycosyltransferase